jgi:hypothetical protein
MIDMTIVFTEGRLRELGLQGPAAAYLVVQFGEEVSTHKWFDDLDDLVRWALAANPRNMFTRTLGVDIHCDLLVELLRGRVPGPGTMSLH